MSSATSNYGLRLVKNCSGKIAITGWVHADITDSNSTVNYWPEYPLCDSPAELADRFEALKLSLAPGADYRDLDRGWDVYVEHPDVTALRRDLAHVA